ncbi:ureidoglycolate lyase [Niveibacterium sp. COAC-50]|uniref:ureidoglycolate lyase n=1 Tax=Niveibacterium sp. COAC-50 TaxID=2729384 RepID=UPI0015582FDB
MKVLPVEELTREAFAPFGDVIEASDSAHHFAINGGNTERYHDLARLEPGEGGRIIVSIFRAQPRPLPFAVTLLERHPLGSQAFVPLSLRNYLVVVALEPTPSALRCFLAHGAQGVNYAPATWHHPLLALDEISDFLVLDRSGTGSNCDEITLTEQALVAPFRGTCQPS